MCHYFKDDLKIGCIMINVEKGKPAWYISDDNGSESEYMRYDGTMHSCMRGDGGTYFKTKAEAERVMEEFTKPKTWGEMTDAEKGALLLAHHEGKVIESTAQMGKSWRVVDTPGWFQMQCYRVRPPEPVHMIEEIIINNLDGTAIGSGTVKTINGKPVWESLKVVEKI